MADPLTMSDLLSEAVEAAIGKVLADNKAMSNGFIAIFDYVRIEDDDDETGKYFALCSSPSLSNVSLIGMARVMGKWGDETADAMFAPDDEDD